MILSLALPKSGGKAFDDFTPLKLIIMYEFLMKQFEDGLKSVELARIVSLFQKSILINYLCMSPKLLYKNVHQLCNFF